MPYASKAQQRYFHANRAELERQGVDVDEWDRETNFKSLPEKKSMIVQIRPRPDSVTPTDSVDAGPGAAPAIAQRGAAPGQMSGVKGASWFAPIKESASRSIPREVQDRSRLEFRESLDDPTYAALDRIPEHTAANEDRRRMLFGLLGGAGLGVAGAVGGGLLGADTGDSAALGTGLGLLGSGLGALGGGYAAGIGADARSDAAVADVFSRAPVTRGILERHQQEHPLYWQPERGNPVSVSGPVDNPVVARTTPAEYAAGGRWNHDDLVRYLLEGGTEPTVRPAAKIGSWFAPMKVGDKLPGGLADWRPDSDFDSVELAKGQAVEMEHTDDPSIAREIAKDHLVEDPRYYVALKVMEDHLEDTEKKASDRTRFVAYYLRKGLEKGSLAPR